MEQTQLPTAQALGEMYITDVLERWPQTADVFRDHAMACVGCAVASFYTINDAALVYRLPADNFVAEMLTVIEGTQETNHE